MPMVIRMARGVLVLVLCVGVRAQVNSNARLQAAEQVLNRYYRGERLEDALDRSNAGIQAYNAHALAVQAETATERTKLDRVLADLEGQRSQLKDLDLDLKQHGDGLSQDVIRRKVEARNALVRQLNEQSAKARPVIEAYNALVVRTQQDLEQRRKQAMDAQAAVNARLAAFSAFSKSGEDVAFFQDLNRLLAETRERLRKTPGDTALELNLSRIRALRRELATWVMVGQARKPNGLVVIEVLVGDEPSWFIVDTGAMDTIVSEELLEAIDQGATLGKETTLSVVGGLRVTGLACRILRLTASGQTLTDVSASAVRPSDVGIDGLLGQSFLKSFVYTIDEQSPAKLLLIRK